MEVVVEKNMAAELLLEKVLAKVVMRAGKGAGAFMDW
jgi:hypothetical protein